MEYGHYGICQPPHLNIFLSEKYVQGHKASSIGIYIKFILLTREENVVQRGIGSIELAS